MCEQSQIVKVGNSYSDPVKIPSGIPQYTDLGPLLFVICINDLPGVCSHLCNPDDAKLYKSIYSNNDSELLSHACKELHDWCDTWLMNEVKH